MSCDILVITHQRKTNVIKVSQNTCFTTHAHARTFAITEPLLPQWIERLFYLYFVAFISCSRSFCESSSNFVLKTSIAFRGSGVPKSLLYLVAMSVAETMYIKQELQHNLQTRIAKRVTKYNEANTLLVLKQHTSHNCNLKVLWYFANNASTKTKRHKSVTKYLLHNAPAPARVYWNNTHVIQLQPKGFAIFW